MRTKKRIQYMNKMKGAIRGLIGKQLCLPGNLKNYKEIRNTGERQLMVHNAVKRYIK